jgi:hypothetical protein
VSQIGLIVYQRNMKEEEIINPFTEKNEKRPVNADSFLIL